MNESKINKPNEVSIMIKSESNVKYEVEQKKSTIVEEAINFLTSQLKKPEAYISSPVSATNLLKLKLMNEHREHFVVMFLDQRHGVISTEILFSGTINAAAVYPREVIKRALELNAAALILSHNHPSGNPKPSDADDNITDKINQCCKLFDIRVLDHIIIAGEYTYSYAEAGKL
jgi:DNA repair protein RadC